MLAQPEFSTQGILKKFSVTHVCTTDDPTDDLRHHADRRQGRARDASAAGLPAGRRAGRAPARVFQRVAGQAGGRQRHGDRELARRLLEALRQRLDFFHARGCRLSDHGLERCYAEPCTDAEAARDLRRGARAASRRRPEDAREVRVVRDALPRPAHTRERGWTMQLHLGALRNNNTRLLRELGPDTGFDSHRRLPAGLALSRLPRTGSTARTHCRRPSSTTSTRRITTPSPR